MNFKLPIFSFLIIFIISLYMMAGAYAGTELVQNKIVSDKLEKINKIIDNKLDEILKQGIIDGK